MKEQIEKKRQALQVADPGSDLFSVQALQRQHEIFERDFMPLGEKVGHLLPSCSNTSLFTSMPLCGLLCVSIPQSLLSSFSLSYSVLDLVPVPKMRAPKGHGQDLRTWRENILK